MAKGQVLDLCGKAVTAMSIPQSLTPAHTLWHAIDFMLNTAGAASEPA